jgi:pyrroline-5-carboxylate reductase
MFDEISKKHPLVLVGCGKMGGALLGGWAKAGLAAAGTCIVEPAGRDAVSGAPGKARFYSSAADLPADLNPRIIVLAVKPQIMGDVLRQLQGQEDSNALILSIAAGYRIQGIAEVLGEATPVIRAMPNTPAAVGKGISAAVRSTAATAEDHALVEALLAAVGEVVWVDSEDDLDAVTGLSGSGPAYVFHMVEAMAAAGEAAGLDKDLACRLARHTVIGAAALLESSGEDARTLRRNVTSPKGTTEAALEIIMAENGLSDLMRRAVRAATKRGRELSSGG